jgi:predicted Zn-dependent protease
VRAARVVLLAGALIVAAWFALGGSQADEINTVTSMLASNSHLSRAQASRADGLLSSAGVLNPDRNVTLLRGEVALQAGRVNEAQRLIGQVTSAEPDNIDAWAETAHAYGGNFRIAQHAYAELARLDPLILKPGSR